jgi:hypothetical protein
VSISISWASNKQPIVSLSKTKEEYVAKNAKCFQVVWLRRILSELNQYQQEGTPIFYDNQSSIYIYIYQIIQCFIDETKT